MSKKIKIIKLHGIFLLLLFLLWPFIMRLPPLAPPAAVPDANKTIYVRDIWVSGHSQPHPELCPAKGAHLRLLILVMSAPDRAAARTAVRLTWGQYRTSKARDVALAFVLGVPPPELKLALDSEDELYGDLIRGRSVDCYYNLTLKTLSLLEWTNTYCPQVRYLLKTDDDVFINVPKLLQFVSDPSRVKAVRTIWGWIWRRRAPRRSIRSKYYMPEDEFSGKVYPDFVAGPAYLITNDSIPPLLAAAPNEKYFYLEDVFVTGVMAQKLGIARRHVFEFNNKILRAVTDSCKIKRLISIHRVNYQDQFYLWHNLLSRKNCSKAQI